MKDEGVIYNNPDDRLWYFNKSFKLNAKNVEALVELSSKLTKKSKVKTNKPKRKYTKKSIVSPTNNEEDPHADLAEEISKAVEAAVEAKLGPALTSLQCMQRHLDIIATKINIDLSWKEIYEV